MTLDSIQTKFFFTNDDWKIDIHFSAGIFSALSHFVAETPTMFKLSDGNLQCEWNSDILNKCKKL